MVECDCTRDEEIIIGLTREYVRGFEQLMDNRSVMPIADGVTVYYTHWNNRMYVLLVDTWTSTVSLASVECPVMGVPKWHEAEELVDELGQELFPENLYREQAYAGGVAEVLAKHLCKGGV